MSEQKLIIGDCREILPTIPDSSVDLAMTSPPYGNARKDTYGGIEPDHYNEWISPIASELLRTLKPTGSFILNIGDNTIDGETHTYTYDIPSVFKKLGFKFIDALIWHKKNPICGKYKNRFKPGWEFCYHFSKTLDIKFIPYAVAEPTKKTSIERALRQREDTKNNSCFTGSGFKTQSGAFKLKEALQKRTASGFTSETEKLRTIRRSGSPFGTTNDHFDHLDHALPSNVIYMNAETQNQGHPAVFPIELPLFFIKTFTNMNDMVLDPFCGSGTTLEACRQLNRNAIGIEINPIYKSVSVKRARLDEPPIQKITQVTTL